LPKVAEAQFDITMPWIVEVHFNDGSLGKQLAFQTWRDASKLANNIQFLQKYHHNDYWRTIDRVYVRAAYLSIN